MFLNISSCNGRTTQRTMVEMLDSPRLPFNLEICCWLLNGVVLDVDLPSKVFLLWAGRTSCLRPTSPPTASPIDLSQISEAAMDLITSITGELKLPVSYKGLC